MSSSGLLTVGKEPDVSKCQVMYDVAPDGRFLAVVPALFAARKPLIVIVNWVPHAKVMV
jgi:hypothetical protein